MIIEGIVGGLLLSIEVGKIGQDFGDERYKWGGVHEEEISLKIGVNNLTQTKVWGNIFLKNDDIWLQRWTYGSNENSSTCRFFISLQSSASKPIFTQSNAPHPVIPIAP